MEEKAHLVINCAGNEGDSVEKMAGNVPKVSGNVPKVHRRDISEAMTLNLKSFRQLSHLYPQFNVRPGKGEFIVFDRRPDGSAWVRKNIFVIKSLLPSP